MLPSTRSSILHDNSAVITGQGVTKDQAHGEHLLIIAAQHKSFKTQEMLLQLGNHCQQACSEAKNPAKKQTLCLKVLSGDYEFVPLTIMLMEAIRFYTVAASEPAKLPEAQWRLAGEIRQQASKLDQADDTAGATVE